MYPGYDFRKAVTCAESGRHSRPANNLSLVDDQDLLSEPTFLEEPACWQTTIAIWSLRDRPSQNRKGAVCPSVHFRQYTTDHHHSLLLLYVLYAVVTGCTCTVFLYEHLWRQTIPENRPDCPERRGYGIFQRKGGRHRPGLTVHSHEPQTTGPITTHHRSSPR